jgi:hypothetical protein
MCTSDADVRVCAWRMVCGCGSLLRDRCLLLLLTPWEDASALKSVSSEGGPLVLGERLTVLDLEESKREERPERVWYELDRRAVWYSPGVLLWDSGSVASPAGVEDAVEVLATGELESLVQDVWGSDWGNGGALMWGHGYCLVGMKLSYEGVWRRKSRDRGPVANWRRPNGHLDPL